MKATLKVKNFGPIKDAELDLRNVNVFIGPQSSGKSTLAKLYNVCRTPLRYFVEDIFDTFETDENIKKRTNQNFYNQLEILNIKNYLNDTTYFKFTSETHTVEFLKGKISLKRTLLDKIDKIQNTLNNESIEKANILVRNLINKNSFSGTDIVKSSQEKEDGSLLELLMLHLKLNKRIGFNEGDLKRILEKLKNTEQKLLNFSTYIPAERILIPILKGSVFNLINQNVPIPKHILSFAAEYEKSRSLISEIDLSFLKQGFFLKQNDGEDRFFYKENESLLLTEASTGIQSLVPLLFSILAEKKSSSKHGHDFVIEEPEMNLYPKAQYSLMKFLERDRKDGTLKDTFLHLYTTHSPYILSSFNNMLYAYKKSILAENDKLKLKEIEEVMPKENWLNPDNFNAYTIIDGTAIQIFDRENGLIDDNVIDEVTDEMNNDFDQLLEL